MIAPTPHSRYEELAAGHALAALEPGEEQEFLRHLSGCAACERSVAEHLDTLSHLAYAADPVPLPPQLLDGIRTAVRASSSALGGPAPSAPISLDTARRRRARASAPARWVGVAAAAALVLSLGVWNVSLQRSQTESEQQAAALAGAVRLLESPTTRRIALADRSGRQVAFAVVHDKRVSLVVSGLPANDKDESIYVLWQTGDAGTRAVGTFDVESQEVAVVRDLPLTVFQYSAFAVTHEKGREAPKAPGALPVADGSLSA